MSGTNFFEFREKMSTRKAQSAPATGAEALSVTQVTALIDRALRAGVPANVLVKGEVSNLSAHRASGHVYFTLKDAGACIDCVMFRSDAERLKFNPADGMELLAGGRVGIYAQRGRYQLYVTTLSPLGQGALELAFQQLRAKLEAEGLFAPERKKALPRFPMNIAIVTSRNTAALQDILKVLRRFPFLRLMIFHVSVQGKGSAQQIAEALRLLNRRRQGTDAVDVILLGRGGGSLEDLWEFNEEIVARAIFNSSIPVVSGIGHEVDTSIADLVADYHAHTPTEAAQVVVAQWRNARESVETIASRSQRAIEQLLARARQRLDAIERHEHFRRPLDRVNQLRQLLDDRQRALGFALTSRLRDSQARVQRIAARLGEYHPRHQLRSHRQRVGELDTRLGTAMARVIERQRAALNGHDAQLQALSPVAVLKRGYSITTMKKGGVVVRSADQVKTGDRLMTRFADGTVESSVEDQKQLPLFE